MPPSSEKNLREKESLHPRNVHRTPYNFEQLSKCTPQLRAFVKLNKYHIESIDFSNPEAVKVLNKALLKCFYGVNYWDIPEGYLCPPIPGRADYIHYAADLLAFANEGIVPIGHQIKVLDIGAGANCIYPLLGNWVHGWQFVGTDIDPAAINSANKIIAANPHIKNNIICRLQTSANAVFYGMIKPEEVFDLTLCNPPFHGSWQEAQAGTTRKLNNLSNGKPQKAVLNFGGKNNELWCAGGEAAFIGRMIEQSALFGKNVFWFSTLVSKKDTLAVIYKALKKVAATEVKIINMSQGQKVSRIVAWTFLNEAEQTAWKNKRWRQA